MELPENTRIYKHAIELVEGKQALYGLIYTLTQVDLETLKVYIEIYFMTGFIRPWKSPAKAPILFYKKSDSSPWFVCQLPRFKQPNHKNRYSLSMIDKFLDRLD